MLHLVDTKDLEKIGYTPEQLLEKFTTQLIKDFEMCGVYNYITIPEYYSYDTIHQSIYMALKTILAKEPSKYQSLLYRIDVSEKDFEKAVKEQIEKEPMSIMADFIIKRILQKIILKEFYSK